MRRINTLLRQIVPRVPLASPPSASVVSSSSSSAAALPFSLVRSPLTASPVSARAAAFHTSPRMSAAGAASSSSAASSLAAGAPLAAAPPAAPALAAPVVVAAVAPFSASPSAPPPSDRAFTLADVSHVPTIFSVSTNDPADGSVAVAKLEYETHTPAGAAPVLEITHTLVPPAFRGKGVAALLCDAAFAYARAAGMTVRPTCTYVSDTYLKKGGKHNADIVEAK